MNLPNACPQELHEIQSKLEARGFKFTMQHLPNVGHIFGTGITVIEAEGPEGIYSTTAWCSGRDQFCRAEGARVAFNKIIHQISDHVGRNTVKEWL